MSMVESLEALNLHNTIIRNSVQGKSLEVFPSIYQQETNIAIWQRVMPDELTSAVGEFLKTSTNKQAILKVNEQDVHEQLFSAFEPTAAVTVIADDIAQLVSMFCCLFGIEHAGLRLTILEHAMCPRFHVDRIPCRLITTYQGVATQWLEHAGVNRSKLGTGNQGLPDEQSGLISKPHNIQQLNCGDVALLKGEMWDEQQGAGLVHRSPPLAVGESRLLLTLDFIQ
ncbi:DUF1826 domain-containing protein [Shewanella frigidimarina]|uniref:Succinylglutamate desuccinylase n=1 Tax=Shewanella frigidimarina TaxID=56812 RepID=A0A125BEC3_SHEFR|nr:DUF1826 domain-containing protein [Shewanella frigidimarina]KVX01385.1 succinylglutamate desuccinylase [Shewanella frigidimarina]